MTMLHDRKYFFKYATSETVLTILQKRTVKYISPAIFNDPFDTQTRIGFSFEESEFVKQYRDELYRLIFADEEPSFIDNTAVFLSNIQVLRRVVKNSRGKMSKGIYDDMTNDIVADWIKELKQAIEDINEWWIRAVRATKVFCVAERADNLLMWAHYAKDHTGAVIEFQCLPELDTPLCAAREVNYVSRPPVIANLGEYVKYMTGQGEPRHGLNIYDMCLSKSEHWKYEQEWRVFILPADMDNSIIPKDPKGDYILCDFLDIYPQEIHAIYFGCKMTPDIRAKISSYLTGDLANVETYDCIKSEREYKLMFNRITG
jgi:hypothetical protein